MLIFFAAGASGASAARAEPGADATKAAARNARMGAFMPFLFLSLFVSVDSGNVLIGSSIRRSPSALLSLRARRGQRRARRREAAEAAQKAEVPRHAAPIGGREERQRIFPIRHATSANRPPPRRLGRRQAFLSDVRDRVGRRRIDSAAMGGKEIVVGVS